MFAAERLHGDDTTILILAKGQCITGRIWTYVCDDRPFGGLAPPAAVFYASSIGVANIRNDIWPSSAVSCRPIATMASIRSLTEAGNKSR